MTDEKPRKPRAGKVGAHKAGAAKFGAGKFGAGKPGGDKPMRRSRDGAAPAPDQKCDFEPRAKGGAPGRAPSRAASDDRRAAADKRPRFEKSEKPAFRSNPRKVEREPVAPPEKTSAFEGERIAKAMARAGVCSRRDAENWIADGRVSVNGRVLTSPAVNVKDSDRIEIDGAPMQARERTRLFLFHKPAGLVTTARDEEGRSTVFDYLAERHPGLPRLVSIGRLDINTEGLLLLTNDGGLARTLELPATGWTRRYRVRAHGATDQAQLDALREGVTIDEVNYAPIEARLEREQGSNVWVAMALTEGKNREVKRVMAHLGLDVTRLIRISYGPFQLGELDEGAVEEVRLRTLREQLGKTLAELAGVDFGAPLRETTPAEDQEKRERLDKRPRKHVSVMREERDETRARGPRARVTTAATADRKGRAVAVERVTLVRPRRERDAAPESRNARRFAAMRDDGGRPPRADDARTRDPKAARDRRDARDTGTTTEKRARPAPRSRAGASEATTHFQRDTRASSNHARGRAEDAARPRFDKRPQRDGDAPPRREGQERSRAFETRGGAPRGRDDIRGGQRAEGAGRARREGPSRFEEAGSCPPRKGPPKSGAGRDAQREAPRNAGPHKGPARKGPPGKGGPHKGGPRKGPPRKGPPRTPRGA